jgi:hypothetical protein
MSSDFGAAMFKISLLGQNKNKMVDCSEVIPQAKPLRSKSYFPANLTIQDLDKPVSSFDTYNKVFELSLHVFNIVQVTFP